MKKKGMAILLAVTMLSMTACGGKDVESEGGEQINLQMVLLASNSVRWRKKEPRRQRQNLEMSMSLTMRPNRHRIFRRRWICSMQRSIRNRMRF